MINCFDPSARSDVHRSGARDQVIDWWDYHDEGVLGEEAVAEPGDGAEGEAEGEADGQELDALGLHHLDDDAERRHEHGHGEGQAHAAEELDTEVLADAEEGDADDEPERPDVHEEEVGQGPQPRPPGRVHEVEDDVGELHAAPEGVDGQ